MPPSLSPPFTPSHPRRAIKNEYEKENGERRHYNYCNNFKHLLDGDVNTYYKPAYSPSATPVFIDFKP